MTRDQEGTRVDLGEDLLEPTRVIQKPAIKKATETKALDPKDLLASVEIYIDEGFLTDAKKILHKLWSAPEAQSFKKQIQKYIDQVQSLELAQILKTKKEKTPQNQLLEASSEQTLAQLEKDLGIADHTSEVHELFFQSHDLTPRDRIDLAIGLIQMELYSSARELLVRNLATRPNDVDTLTLLAEIQLLKKDPFPAIAAIQSALGDTDLAIESRVHLLYAMARLRESMVSLNEALAFYKQVQMIDPQYRDVAERLRKLIP